MDTISFDITNSVIDDYLTPSIFINGYDLKGILAAIEQRQIEAGENENFVGAYEGISPFIAFHSHDHFLKNTINEYHYYDNKFALLEYVNSGIPGDHTIACNIDILKDTVKWYNFQNYSLLMQKQFTYEGLSFTFHKKQYKEAITAITNTKIKELYL